MAWSARPRRPFVVTLLALLPLALALWYVVSGVQAIVLFVGETLFGGPGQLSTVAHLGSILLAGASFGAAAWSFATGHGLFGGASWARISALLLALFALPMGYPTDLVVTVIVALVLFVWPSARAFFR
jgi:hypothetical protein